MSRRAEQRFNRLALGGLVASFLLLALAFALTLYGLQAARRSGDLVTHTYEVKDQVATIRVSLERAESARRGYLLSPSGYRAATYRGAAKAILPALDELQGLTADNPAQQRRIAELRPLILQELNQLDRSMAMAEAGRLEAARAEFITYTKGDTLRALRERAQAIGDSEERLLGERSAAVARQQQTLTGFLVLVGILLASIGAGTFVLVRRYTRDLNRTHERLHLLNTNLEGAVAERTADLRRANDEIQRFAYIVSHDLRSPLVNVLGFTAELERADTVLGRLIEDAEREAPSVVTEEVRQARADLPEAIGFIRASTQKMDRLINAILKLSREGRRTVVPEKLPMAKLIADIGLTLEQMMAANNARLIAHPPIPDVVSDRLAVEQIFANLIENAAKYGRPGQPVVIEVSAEKHGSQVVYSIRDNGRGIDRKDHERVFDLFRRSGSQDQAGEGIGLAHVRASVHRLGGQIILESRLGEGTEFRLSLPETFTDQGVTP